MRLSRPIDDEKLTWPIGNAYGKFFDIFIERIKMWKVSPAVQPLLLAIFVSLYELGCDCCRPNFSDFFCGSEIDSWQSVRKFFCLISIFRLSTRYAETLFSKNFPLFFCSGILGKRIPAACAARNFCGGSALRQGLTFEARDIAHEGILGLPAPCSNLKRFTKPELCTFYGGDSASVL